MDPDLFRIALRAILAAIVTKIADQFLFLGIDGDRRLLFGQSRRHLRVDVAELRVPIGMAFALRGLAVALQAVTRIVEQFGDQGVAHLMTLHLQRLRQPTHALAGPPQRQFRIAPRARFDQALQVLEQGGILRDCRFAPGSRPANARRGLLPGQFLHAPPDRARRNSRRHCHCCNPTVAGGERLRRRYQTTAAFVEKRRDHRKPLSDGLKIDHRRNIWYHQNGCKPPIRSIKSQFGNFLTSP